MAQEQVCCPYLQFDVTEEPDAVRVAITAPEGARDAAGELFAQFMPDRLPAAAER